MANRSRRRSAARARAGRWRSPASVRAAATRRHLTFERLDLRLLLAADVLANAPPFVSDPVDDVAMAEDDAARVVDLSAVFDDPDLDNGNADQLSLEITGNSNPALLSASLDGPSLTLTLLTDQHGQASISVTATDQAGESATDTFLVTVSEVNDAPRVRNDLVATQEDMPLQIDASALLANDSPGPANENAQSLTIVTVSASSAQGGTLALDNDGNISYVPPPDYHGTDVFSYVVADDGTTGGSAASKTAIALVTVTITEANDAPQPVDDAVEVSEDSVIVLASLLANDTAGPANESGQTLQIVSVSASSQGGLVSLQADGSVGYEPPADFVGSDSFTYTVEDNGTTAGAADPQQAIGTVLVAVGEVNDAPTAQADALTTPEDAPLSVSAADLLSNDTPGPANEADQTLTVVSVAAASTAGGQLLLTNGTITYSPPADFHGQDQFTYTVSDSGKTAGQPDPRTATGTVTVTVTNVNDPPTVDFIAAELDEDGPPLTIAFPGDDVDPDEDRASLTYVFLSQPGEGQITNNGDGSFTFDPGDAFQDLPPDQTRVLAFSYKATDAHGAESEPGTIVLTVRGINDLPVSTDSELTMDQDQILRERFNANDFDSDDDFSTLEYVIVDPPSAGTVTIHDDGTFSFDPGGDFDYLPVDQTAEVSFTFKAIDAHGAETGLALVRLTIAGINDQPTGQPLALEVSEDDTSFSGTFPGNDVDLDDDRGSLSYTIVTDPDQGEVTNHQDGTFTFRPQDDFQDLVAGQSRTVSFAYRASDRHGSLSEPAIVEVVVAGSNDRPVASNDGYRIQPGEQLSVPADGVLANDQDADGDELEAILIDPAAVGTVSLSPDGSFTYTPAAGFSGTDSFTYRATDGELESDTTLVIIQVNEPPVAIDDFGQTTINMPVTLSVLENDSDADGSLDPTTVTIVQGPGHGAASVNGDGTINYVPELNFQGSDTFSYVVDDNEGAMSNEALVTISIVPEFSACPWQNPLTAVDVNDDGAVTPIDVLIIINELNSNGPHALPNPPIPPQAPPPYLDVNCDNNVTPVDALTIINFLNAQPAPGGGEGDQRIEGEGEALEVHPHRSQRSMLAAAPAAPVAPRVPTPSVAESEPSAGGLWLPEREQDGSPGVARVYQPNVAARPVADSGRDAVAMSQPADSEAPPESPLDISLVRISRQQLEESLEEILDDIAPDISQA